MIAKFFMAASSPLGFKLAWKRMTHIQKGHPFNERKPIDVMRSEKHPHTSADYIYTVRINECQDCGLCYIDSGLEKRAYTPSIKIESLIDGWDVKHEKLAIIRDGEIINT